MIVEVRYSVKGTGIRRGMRGCVIYEQNGFLSSPCTNLAKHAYLVRFKGGAEIWMEPWEVRIK